MCTVAFEEGSVGHLAAPLWLANLSRKTHPAHWVSMMTWNLPWDSQSALEETLPMQVDFEVEGCPEHIRPT